MAEINSPSASSPAQSMNFMQDQMHAYLNSCQTLLRSALDGPNVIQVGQDTWERQMAFASKLMEASRMVLQATGDYIEKSVSETANGWHTTQAASAEIVKQQNR